MTKPKITIITVVLNAAKTIEYTINSVKNTSYRNIEYIIIDAASKDGTVDIIKSYDTYINKWISAPDNGLYFAMNKGLKMASGEYVMFLNAGDTFYDNEVLNRIFSLSTSKKADLFYGETMVVNNKGNEIGMRRLKAPKRLTWRDMKNGMIVCHQSVIVKRSIAPLFNTEFKVASDYLWVLQSLKYARLIVNTELIISRFLDGGINKSNILRALRERFIIMIREFGFIPTLLQHIIIAGRFIIYFIKNRRF